MEFKKTTDTVRSMTSACQLHIYENNKDFKKGQIVRNKESDIPPTT